MTRRTMSIAIFAVSLVPILSGPLDATVEAPASMPEFEGHGAAVTAATFEGKDATRLRHLGDDGLARAVGIEFCDGELEVELAGTVDPDAFLITRKLTRAFIGLAFRVRADVSAYEKIYLRLINARDEDQLRRNHSTQYSSYPDHPWRRLRDESPGRYESYVDLAPGVWTKLRITVAGETAKLFVDDAEQPCLVVTDLKLEPATGGVALYVGQGTVGYFRNLRVQPGSGS